MPTPQEIQVTFDKTFFHNAYLEANKCPTSHIVSYKGNLKAVVKAPNTNPFQIEIETLLTVKKYKNDEYSSEMIYLGNWIVPKDNFAQDIFFVLETYAPEHLELPECFIDDNKSNIISVYDKHDANP